MSKTKKMVLLGILVSQALILNLVERMIPVPVPVPGIKLGLANAISLIAIILFGPKEALIVVGMRTFLGSVFGGGISSFIYSFIGGTVSTMAMAIMYKKFRTLFSLPAISVIGAVFHNTGQILVASLIIENAKLFYYLPALLISAVITGLFIGFAVQYTLKPMSHILGIGSDTNVE
ncbi:MAG TPA: Gx transporter family protein [Candidatus Diapherotrites archaeon]|nr:Gx transporter family protein [Candidatus Diapherotrites archaeon]